MTISPEFINSIAAVIIGALVSVVISTLFARREQMRKIQIETTLRLFEQYQSNEMVTSRNKANKLLSENKKQPRPLSYGELYDRLPSEEYDHIARILQFFTQVAVLHRAKYLDHKLVHASLGRYFEFWYGQHFELLWRISKEKGEPAREWVEPMAYLAKEMKLTHSSSSIPAIDPAAATQAPSREIVE